MFKSLYGKLTNSDYKLFCLLTSSKMLCTMHRFTCGKVMKYDTQKEDSLNIEHRKLGVSNLNFLMFMFMLITFEP